MTSIIDPTESDLVLGDSGFEYKVQLCEGLNKPTNTYLKVVGRGFWILCMGDPTQGERRARILNASVPESVSMDVKTKRRE